MLTGKGVSVAVIDTGVYPHIDFDNRIIQFVDFVNGRRLAYDNNSHGTHVAGIIGGSGKASDGKYMGIAPQCNIVALKVLDRNGDGRLRHVFNCIDWIKANYRKYNIKIINISFGMIRKNTKSEKYLLEAIDNLWDLGIAVVIASGNNGPKKGSVTVPGVNAKAITVGALDDDYMVDERGVVYRDYSGRGPVEGMIIKPEIVAPGSQIVSCSNKNNEYQIKSGTSMAAPIVSGAIALLLEKNPEYTPAQIKNYLCDNAIDMKMNIDKQGYGAINMTELLLDNVKN